MYKWTERVFQEIHREQCHKTVGGTIALPEVVVERHRVMFATVAVGLGVSETEARRQYAAWAADQPTGCACEGCEIGRRTYEVLRERDEVERARLAVGAYRDDEGFWVFPNGLPPGDDWDGLYQTAPGVWVSAEGCSAQDSV
ncbi:hypothetical protein ACWDUX_29965 [Streptomyces sp. NPDC003444]